MFYPLPPNTPVNVQVYAMDHCNSKAGWRQLAPEDPEPNPSNISEETGFGGYGGPSIVTVVVLDGKMIGVIMGDGPSKRWICQRDAPKTVADLGK